MPRLNRYQIGLVAGAAPGVSYCGHPLKYDHGRVTPITLHLVMFDKAFFPFGW